MKILKKLWYIAIITIIIITLSTNVFATDLKTTLNVIESASETKYLENDQGYISKTIVDSNSDTGEVTIELKLSNTKKETTTSGDTEIILVIDNSKSMDYKTADGQTRKSILLNSAKTLVNDILGSSKHVKIGIVRFAGKYGNSGIMNLYPCVSTITKPTSSKEDVLQGLTTLKNKSTEPNTNIQEGLIQAENSFSKNAGNKVIILLTDGIPTEDHENNLATTTEKLEIVLANTKNEIINIKNQSINLISLMTGVNSNDIDDKGNVITTTEYDIQAIETIFGTEANPTYGKFYNVKTTDLAQVIENDISNDLHDILNSPLNTVKIVDYFPNDITDNFDFSYVGNPSKGSVSASIDSSTNTIEWDIGTLNGNEVATLRYKLKIKDMKNENLLNKTIATNEKVVLTYKDIDNMDYTVTLSSSPKIRLSELKEELTATVSYNPTTETVGSVKATIRTNKRVNPVNGWLLSDDGMTLTKMYSTNTTELVHLVDLDGMTKDVTVSINNIKTINVNTNTNTNNNNNNTNNRDDKFMLPQTGIDNKIIIAVIVVSILSIFAFIKIKLYKDIK